MSLRKRPFLIALVAVLLCAVIYFVWAGNTTSATGGTAISADTAANGGSGAWTTLTGPTYAETINGDIANGGFLTLSAPAGFAFNTANLVRAMLIAGNTNNDGNTNEAVLGGAIATTADGSLNVSASTISFYVSSKSRGNTRNIIRFEGIQVRPLEGSPLASGNIVLGLPPGSASASSTNAGTLTVVPGAVARLHTVLPGQSFVTGGAVTGTPATQSAGVAFAPTQLVATDRFNNIVTSYTGTKTISYSGPFAGCGAAPTYTTNVSFSSGSSTTALTTTLYKAETTSMSASDGSVTGPASSAFTVLPAPATRLVVTLPGQGFTPCLGTTGTPTQQAAGVAFTITHITATDAWFNIVTTYAGTKALSYSGPSGAATYTSPVSFTAGRSTTDLATTISTAQTTSISVGDGAIGGPASTPVVVAPSVDGFDGFDTSTAATAVAGRIKTKIAAGEFKLAIIAKYGAALATGFTGTVKVELVDASSGACASLALVRALPSQSFVAGDNGRRTVEGIVEANAWRNVRLRISYPVTSPTVVSCSTDNFSIRPERFGEIAASDLNETTTGTARALANLMVPGGVVHKAGQPFTITASALNADGATTTNYVQTPQPRMQACADANVCPPATALGVLSFSSGTVSAGVLTTTDARYSEVGAFALVVEDLSFADADIGDSSPLERTITSAPVAIGRFVPDHFAVVPGALVARTDLPACAASIFTYMDEPFAASFTLRAQGAAPGNTITRNYQGALATLDIDDGGHLNPGAISAAVPTAGLTALVAPIGAITRASPGRVTTVTRHGLATGGTVFLSGVAGMTNVNNQSYEVTVIDPYNFTINASTVGFPAYTSGGNASRLALVKSSGAWAAGVADVTATLMLRRSAAPDGPFKNVSIGINPRDLDGVTLASANLDADGNGSSERHNLGATRFLFGRLLMNNAYGSSVQDLRIPLQAQYWTGFTFLLNGDDNCTTLASAGNIAGSNYRGGITAANMALPAHVLPGGPLTGGAGRFTLSRPLPAPATKGSVDMVIDLTAENMQYLRSRGAAGRYDQNPGSRATFGSEQSGRLIHVRDAY